MLRLCIPDPELPRQPSPIIPALLHLHDNYKPTNMHENSQQVKTKYDSKFLNWTPYSAGAQSWNPFQPLKIVYGLPWLSRTLSWTTFTHLRSFGALNVVNLLGIYPAVGKKPFGAPVGSTVSDEGRSAYVHLHSPSATPINHIDQPWVPQLISSAVSQLASVPHHWWGANFFHRFLSVLHGWFTSSI